VTKHIIVTTEWPNIGSAGGIGMALRELAKGLSQVGRDVAVMFVSHDNLNADFRVSFQSDCDSIGAQSINISASETTWSSDVQALSYAAFVGLGTAFDDDPSNSYIVHFADYLGLAFYFLNARRCGLVKSSTFVILHTHGPSEWTFQLNAQANYSPKAMVQIEIERKCFLLCDLVVSPSKYMANWLVENQYVNENESVNLVPNLIERRNPQRRLSTSHNAQVTEDEVTRFDVVIVGRHEPRKGWNLVLNLLDRVSKDTDLRHKINFHLLGQFGEADGVGSAFQLWQRGREWKLNWKLYPELNSGQVQKFIQQRPDSLVVIASPIENSPYVVLESAAVNSLMVCSGLGGASEILSDESEVIDMDVDNLHEIVTRFLSGNVRRSSLRDSYEDQLRKLSSWCSSVENKAQSFVSKKFSTNSSVIKDDVSVVVTHYSRPQALFRCLLSLLQQDDIEFELVLIDDCTPEKLKGEWWEKCVRLVRAMDGKIVEREMNGYLGAARNSGIQVASGNFIVFLDDDDWAFPDFISSIRRAIVHSSSDVIVPLAVHNTAPLHAHIPSESQLERIPYLPTAGPIEVSPWLNPFGYSVIAVRRDCIERVGLYSELHSTGYEDFELAIRLVSMGSDVVVLPRAVFSYSTGGQSMTTTMKVGPSADRIAHAIHTSGASLEQVSRVIRHQVDKESYVNRLIWMLRVRGEDERVISLITERDTKRILSALNELSSGESSYFRNALSIDTSYLKLNFEEPVSHRRHREEMVFPPNEYLAELVLAVETGSENEALSAFERWVAESVQFVPEEIMYVANLSWEKFLPSEEIRIAVTEFVKAETRQAIRTRTSSACLLLAVGAREEALEVISQLFDFDRNHYLSSNHDLHEQIKFKTFPWQHFLRFGRSEGRKGFDHIQAVLSFARKIGLQELVEGHLRIIGLESKFSMVARRLRLPGTYYFEKGI
jgi:glycosyltransferase involved in cell wall biosynthesis